MNHIGVVELCRELIVPVSVQSSSSLQITDTRQAKIDYSIIRNFINNIATPYLQLLIYNKIFIYFVRAS